MKIYFAGEPGGGNSNTLRSELSLDYGRSDCLLISG